MHGAQARRRCHFTARGGALATLLRIGFDFRNQTVALATDAFDIAWLLGVIAKRLAQ
jgi:hypothetical protein